MGGSLSSQRYIFEWLSFRLAFIFSTPIMKVIKEKIDTTRVSYITAVIEPLGYGLMLLWGVSFLILGAHNPFIYFNF